MLRPYPTQVPPEAFSLVISAFSGQPVDKAKAVHAAYEVVGFALGKTLPTEDVNVVGAIVTDARPDDTEVEIGNAQDAFAVVEIAARGGEIVDGHAVSQVSPALWRTILQVALEVLRRR